MKKALSFALIALMAIFATSCEKKKDAPKARFSYEINGLTVKFINVSKDAETYAWDFGDGATSTEKDPMHTFEAYGDYVVKLTAKNAGGENSYQETINLVQRAIAIDGDFSDWAAMAPNQIASCVNSENSVYEDLYAAKFARDDEFIYFYMEFNGGTNIFDVKIYNEDWSEVIRIDQVEGHYAEHVQFYLNCGDETTGGLLDYLWVHGCFDYCIEGQWLDQFEGAAVSIWPHAHDLADDGEWYWEDASVPGTTTACEAVTLENGHFAVEGKITIALLPDVALPLESLKMGVNIQNPGWNLQGILPETAEIEGVEAAGELIEVPLLQ